MLIFEGKFVQDLRGCLSLARWPLTRQLKSRLQKARHVNILKAKARDSSVRVFRLV